MVFTRLLTIVLIIIVCLAVVHTRQAVEINPGDDIQAIVAQHPTGTTFLIKSGVHRLQSITPTANMVFEGEDGTILSGARLLTSFTQESGLWVASGQTQQGEQRFALCQATHPRCTYPEDLFIDNVPLKHVPTLGEVTAGEFYFDYAADKIYFFDDPTGKTVETSVTPFAFQGAAAGVTVRNLIIEKYASPTSLAAIFPYGASNWTIEANTVRFNHGVGIRLPHQSVVINNKIHSNGEMGAVGGDFGMDTINSRFEGNELSFNNYAGYDYYWEAGGFKFVFTEDLIIRNNHSHHNLGIGMWTDIDNVDTLYEGNLVEYNLGSGIAHEISHDAIVRNNTLRYNGEDDVFHFGAQLLIQNSQNVEVNNNTIIVGPVHGNAITILSWDRGESTLPGMGEFTGQNNYIHHNAITFQGNNSDAIIGTQCGQDHCGVDPLTNPLLNNVFENNTYHVISASNLHWLKDPDVDAETQYSWAQWQSLGYDTGSCLDTPANRNCVDPLIPPMACTRPPTGQFVGCYYDNANFGVRKIVRFDAYPLNFDWGNGSPSSSMAANTFSVRWEGFFSFDGGLYDFTTTVNDGVRVYVDGKRLIDQWRNRPTAQMFTAARTMTTGTHRIRIDYYERTGPASINVTWLKRP